MRNTTRRRLVLAGTVLVVSIGSYCLWDQWRNSATYVAGLMAASLERSDGHSLAPRSLGFHCRPRELSGRQWDAILRELGAHVWNFEPTSIEVQGGAAQVQFRATQPGREVQFAIALFKTPRGWLFQDGDLVVRLVTKLWEPLSGYKRLAVAMRQGEIRRVSMPRANIGIYPDRVDMVVSGQLPLAELYAPAGPFVKRW